MKTKKTKPVKTADAKKSRSFKAGLTNCLGETMDKKNIRDLSLFFLEESLCSDYQFSFENRINLY